MSSESNLTSRRALLGGALGGVAAWAAVAAARAERADAAVGDPVRAGQTTTAGGATTSLSNNSDSNHTFVVTQNGNSTAIRGTAASGVGGRFQTGGKNKWGLIATNSAGGVGSGGALYVNGGMNVGVESTSVASAAVAGTSASHVGVAGTSSSSVGVSGVSSTYYGVAATSGSGFGLYAQSGSNYAGYFSGPIFSTLHVDLPEIPVPAIPPANRARIFVRDNGAGKTQLCVLFPAGAVQVLATQP